MFFTQDDYKKIEDWLQKRAVKDTEFPLVNIIDGSELFPIIQEGENRVIDFNDFWGESNRIFKTELKEFAKCVKAKADDLVAERVEAENAIIGDLNKEIQDREQADTALSGSIDKEISDRQSADNTLRRNIENVDLKFANYPKLDNGLIPSTYLPSYVDDVLEYNTLNSFPKTGETGKIYVTLDTNLTYRWTGSNYVEISKSLGLGSTAGTAYPGNKGTDLESRLNNAEGKLSTVENRLNDIEGSQESIPAFTGVNADQGSYTATKGNTSFSISGGTGINTSFKSSTISIGLTDAYKKGTANGIAELDANGRIPSDRMPEGYAPGGGSDLQIGTVEGTAFDGGKGAALETKLNTIEKGAQKNTNSISTVTLRNSSDISESVAQTSNLIFTAGKGVSLSFGTFPSTAVTEVIITSTSSEASTTLPDTAIFVELTHNGSSMSGDLFGTLSTDLIDCTSDTSDNLFNNIEDILAGKKHVFLRNMGGLQVIPCSVYKRTNSAIWLYASNLDIDTRKLTALRVVVNKYNTSGKYANITKLAFSAD